MNVRFQAMNTSYRTPVLTKPKLTPLAPKAAGDYDTVNIRRAQSAPGDDESFARMLARKTASQMTGASQERVKELSVKVADGTYQPDAQRIAGRMLGLG